MERPILFTGLEVRAILDGRKTQTRRIVKPQAPSRFVCGWVEADAAFWSERVAGSFPMWKRYVTCPYGQPGDLLWVRETFAADFLWPEPGGARQRSWYDIPRANRLAGDDTFVMYPATGTVHGCEGGRVDPVACEEWDGDERCVPSIHMPRWASRITLEITEVRVERLQAISEDDCWAEGIDRSAESPTQASTIYSDCAHPRRAFCLLWDSLNAQRGHGWDVNPWCWVIAFKRVEAV